jgi:hypothetical protein
MSLCESAKAMCWGGLTGGPLGRREEMARAVISATAERQARSMPVRFPAAPRFAASTAGFNFHLPCLTSSDGWFDAAVTAASVPMALDRS